MSRCAECDFNWDAPSAELIRDVRRLGDSYRAALGPFLAASTGDTVLRHRPAPAVWSPLEYTAHMRDVVAFYAGRINAVLAEDRPRMTAAHFASMAEARRYNDDDPLDVLNTLDECAKVLGDRLARLAPPDWNRVGLGSEGGERTVLVLARRLAHEGRHHLLDLRRQHQELRGD